MARKRSLSFELDSRLAQQRECNLGVLVPVPISERVEKLADLLYLEGHGTVPRKELVAALLYAAPEDAGELAATLMDYRKATVRQAHVGEPPAGDVITFMKRPPGPRSRSA